MSLRQTNSNLMGVIAFVGLGLLGNTGCSGEAPLPPADTSSVGPAQGDGLQAIGVMTGTVRDGQLSFGELTPTSNGVPGEATESFGKNFSQTKISFATPAGGPGTLGCTATQYCAQVQVTNGTTMEMDNTFVEVTDYFGISPTGTSISWAGGTFPLITSTAYTNVFVNPSNPQGADYGTLLAGATGTVIWKFNAGAATNFNFHVKVYAAFPRVGWSAQLFKGSAAAPAVDACAGSTPTIFNNDIGSDDAETQVTLPFAYTFLNISYDKAAIGANGYVQLYRSTDAGPPAALSVTNSSIFTTGPVGFFPFWDDLGFGADGGVCVTTTGTAPNRIWSVTWKNARVSSNQPAKPGVFAPQEFTFSLALYELNDYTRFYYAAPAVITTQTQGSSASCGLRPPSPAAKFGTTCGFNNLWLGATSASYPQANVFQMGPNNP